MNKEDKLIAKKYKSKTQYEHIRDRPDTYIGSIKKEESEQYVFQSLTPKTSSTSTKSKSKKYKKNNEDSDSESENEGEKSDNENEDENEEENENENEDEDEGENEDDKDKSVKTNLIVNKKIKYIQGLYKIFDEIIVNAVDNKNRVDSKIIQGEKGHKVMTKLKVKIFKFSDDKQEEKYAISVENNGTGIDIVTHPEEKLWVPQMIFGKLLTSSNYDDTEKKITGGKNGFGAKLTNIYSTYFRVETVDNIRKLYYSQIYRNRMLDVEEPEIVKKYKDEPFTRITFVPDYEKFGIDDLSEDFINLFKKRTYDMVYCSNGALDVYYNDELCCCNMEKLEEVKTSKKLSKVKLEEFKRKIQSEEYMKMYIPPDNDNILAIENPHERWQIGATMAPNYMFQQVGFVNGIYTSRGGKHIDYVTKKITSKLHQWIKTKKKQEVRENLIKENLMVFVNSLIENPDFDGQTKDTLKTTPKNFGSSFEISDDFITQLSKTGIVDHVLQLNNFHDTQILKKTDGKKNRRILDIDKLVDARLAGTKNAHKCTLILTEGDSAKATAVTGISVIPTGNDIYGIFPLKGKLLNTCDVSNKTISENEEITNIKKILGLQDLTNYTDIKSLRYGRIMIMTDQDVDGSHIKGLLINYISDKFPSLLKVNGFITSLLTPIVKTWKKSGKKTGNNTKNFYTLKHFRDWLESNNNGYGYNIKYYKGLGTSTPQEAKEYFKDFKLVTYELDDNSFINIDKAFNKNKADDRKQWLTAYDKSVLELDKFNVSYSDFINKDLIQFSIADCERSIPNLMDGLKSSSRKIIYCAFKRNLKDELKVSQFAGYVSEHGAYHHGEASLNGTIVNMAQNYPGTNNINLLVPEGQFGTRLEGGKDSSATRYIFTYLSIITKKIFRDEDKPLLKSLEDDGQLVEPEYYLPIIPMILVNGSGGIGTGWSSSCPQFNPLDVINVIKNKIKGKPESELVPWYRGYKGTIIPSKKKKKDSEALQWKTKGCYKIIDDETVEIFELPIGVWTSKYKIFLDSLILGNEKKEVKKSGRGRSKAGNTTPTAKTAKVKEVLLKDYINESSNIEVKFILKFEKDVLSKLLSAYDSNNDNKFEKEFKLTNTLTCTNTLTFFDDKCQLRNYRTINEVLDIFYNTRLYYYDERKKYMLSLMKEELYVLSVKARFINDIIKKKVKINNVPREEIMEQLLKGKYPKMLDDKLISLEDLDKLTCQDKKNSASYNFLVNMAIYNLTKEKVEELNNKKDLISKNIKLLEDMSVSDLWLKDLEELEEEYKKFMKSYYKDYGLKESDFNINKKKKNFNDMVDNS